MIRLRVTRKKCSVHYVPCNFYLGVKYKAGLISRLGRRTAIQAAIQWVDWDRLHAESPLGEEPLLGVGLSANEVLFDLPAVNPGLQWLRSICNCASIQSQWQPFNCLIEIIFIMHDSTNTKGPTNHEKNVLIQACFSLRKWLTGMTCD